MGLALAVDVGVDGDGEGWSVGAGVEVSCELTRATAARQWRGAATWERTRRASGPSTQNL